MSGFILGVDLATARFELALADPHFQILQRKTLKRAQFGKFCRELPPSLIVMEACSSAHYWARNLQSWGHQVRLLPALYVHAYVRRSKTDAADAAALIEATRCSEIRPVPVKTVEQQHLLQLHRLREQYKRTRNARVNLLRSAFREFGVPLPTGLKHSIRALSDLVHLAPNEMPKELTDIYGRVLEDIEQLQKKLKAVDAALSHLTRTDPVVRGLVTICGVGPIIATAIRASVGEIERFPTGRHFACWLGLTAREYSTGEHRRLGRISRRGDGYLRALLVNGARSALLAANRFHASGDRPLDRLRTWALDIQHRRGMNLATIALANKLARIIWATWRYERSFDGNWQSSAPNSE